jgi:hypothetical protein
MSMRPFHNLFKWVWVSFFRNEEAHTPLPANSTYEGGRIASSIMPTISQLLVLDLSSRPSGSSVEITQSRLPSSLPEKRYPYPQYYHVFNAKSCKVPPILGY